MSVGHTHDERSRRGSPATCRGGLRRAAELRDRAQRELTGATEELAAWCARARTAGLSMTEIAQLARLSRQGAYYLLAHEAASSTEGAKE